MYKPKTSIFKDWKLAGSAKLAKAGWSYIDYVIWIVI